jgi:hypothetical protein
MQQNLAFHWISPAAELTLIRALAVFSKKLQRRRPCCASEVCVRIVAGQVADVTPGRHPASGRRLAASRESTTARELNQTAVGFLKHEPMALSREQGCTTPRMTAR